MKTQRKTTRAQGRKRLLELARFLREEVTDKLFDFGEVMVVGEKEPKDALKAGGGCGTVGCAMGWADVRWPDRGLTKNWGDGDFSANDETIAEFFGVTENEVDFLFYPNNGNHLGAGATRGRVAKHIEKFVADDEKLQALKADVLRGIKTLRKFNSTVLKPTPKLISWDVVPESLWSAEEIESA